MQLSSFLKKTYLEKNNISNTWKKSNLTLFGINDIVHLKLLCPVTEYKNDFFLIQ